MGRNAPMETNLAGKPSITTRQSVKPKGTLSCYSGTGTEYAQVSADTQMKKGDHASAATQKGSLTVNVGHGTEYAQNSSTK